MKREKTNGTVRNKIKDTTSDRIFYTVNMIIWIIILVIVIYPLYVVVISSVSDPYAVMRGEVLFVPVDFSWVGYEAIFEYSVLWRSYLNSIIYTLAGTLLSVMVTLTMAYGLSRRFMGKGIFNFLVVFTMFFSGGLIPTFLWMRDLGLYNSPWIMILMGMVSVWNLMVARTYIQTSIPNELYEAASIDGANRRDMLLHITIPRILPSVAVMFLLSISQLFLSNFDQVYNLYNNFVLNTGDVLSTYIYRISLGGGGEFELSTAANLLLNVMGLIALVVTNRFVKKLDVMGIF
jgi:putative aldouronate transport system permease protein